jgi:trans-aconitate 2-methyltransferase
MTWDPDLYHRFQKERSAPFADALALVARRKGLSVIDLGCGTGELTRKLADALPSSDVVGLDSSAAMLERAQAQVRPGLRFVEGAIEDLTGEYDLIFSHAAIHWIDDQASLIGKLFAQLRPGGQLVVQLPSNPDHPARRAIVEVACEAPFAAALGGFQRTLPALPVDRYAELLFRAGAPGPVAFEKVYPHVLADSGAIADFLRATALLPYLERLTPELGEAFQRRYRERLSVLYPERPVFFGFRRILFAANKPGLGA